MQGARQDAGRSKREPTKRIHVRVPSGVVEQLDAEAAEDIRDRSGMVVKLLCEALEARRRRKRAA